jgi:uncharacterized protein YheU (UPF0270 family)
MEDQELQPPIEIPHQQLSEQALTGLIESYINRYGTDYGASEVSLETKTKQIKSQILKGEVKIVFDPNIESPTLLPKEDFNRLNL